MNAYSEDLRKKIVEAVVERRMPKIEATRTFGVGISSVKRYVATYRGDDEGNAYLRLGDALAQLGRKDEARAAYDVGIAQAEKFGHSGMAEDLRLAIIQLGEQA